MLTHIFATIWPALLVPFSLLAVLLVVAILLWAWPNKIPKPTSPPASRPRNYPVIRKDEPATAAEIEANDKFRERHVKPKKH